MNKKLLTILALSFCSIISFAQTVFEIKDTHSNSLVSNGGIVHSTTYAGDATSNDFDIKNISSITQTFTIIRIDDMLNNVGVGDVAAASFCTGSNCYTPATTSVNFVLNPNAVMVLKADMQEASTAGLSEVRYKVLNTNNTSDAVTFTIKYNSPASIKNNSILLSSVSDVYPTPSNNKAFINISALSNYEDLKLNIINSLGAIVSTKTIDVIIGKNTINLDVEHLSTGIYFATITQGNQRFTKKITISK